MDIPGRQILTRLRRPVTEPSWERIVALHQGEGRVPRACADIVRMMLLDGANAGEKAFLFASAVRSEGKTTMALHLAAMLAARGKRVLLADVHWQSPILSRVLGVAGQPGLANLLASGGPVEELLVPDDRLPGLSVLPAGTGHPDFLHGEPEKRIEALLDHEKRAFDFVLLDGAPVASGSEVLVFARLVDGVLLVTACDGTQQPQVAAAGHSLGQHGGKVAGVILNRVPRYLPDYYRTV